MRLPTFARPRGGTTTGRGRPFPGAWLLPGALAGCEPIGDQKPAGDTDSVLVQTTADYLDLADPIDRVEITGLSGNVEVNAGSEGQVTARKIGGDEDVLAFELAETTLRIWAQCRSGTPGCGAGFQLFVPPLTELQVETVSGAIDLTSGLGGDLVVASESGSITTHRQEGGTTVVTSGSGAVSLQWEEMPVEIDVTTVSGAVDLGLQPGIYAFDLVSNNDVVLPEEGLLDGAGPPVRVRSESGVVTVRAETSR